MIEISIYKTVLGIWTLIFGIYLFFVFCYLVLHFKNCRHYGQTLI